MNRPDKSRTEKVIQNSFVSVIYTILSVILAFVMRSVFIRTLGVEYNGISGLFTSILTVLSLSELGFSTAIATALYLPIRTKDQKQIQKLMYFYKVAYRIVAIVVSVAGLICVPFLDYLVTGVPNISEDLRLIFLLYVAKTSASYLMIYKSTLLQADQKIYIEKVIGIVCLFVRYLIEIIILIIYKQFLAYLVIEVLATIAQNFIVSMRAEKEYPWAFKTPETKLSKPETKKLLLDVKGLAMYQISSSVAGSVDNVLISYYINTVLVGFLSNYILIKNQIQALITQVFSAIMPSVGSVAAENDNQKQYKLYNNLFYVSFLLANFCSVSMFVLFNPFIKLWLGEDYVLGEKVAFVIAFDFFLFIFVRIVAVFRNANGLFLQGQYRPVATTIVNIILSVVLIRHYGIAGTIFATNLARLLTQWFDIYIINKYVFRKKFALLYMKYWLYIMAFLGMCIVTRYISRIISFDNGFIDLLVKGGVCLFIPNTIVLLTCKLDEFAYVKHLGRAVLKRKNRKIQEDS